MKTRTINCEKHYMWSVKNFTSSFAKITKPSFQFKTSKISIIILKANPRDQFTWFLSISGTHVNTTLVGHWKIVIPLKLIYVRVTTHHISQVILNFIRCSLYSTLFDVVTARLYVGSPLSDCSPLCCGKTAPEVSQEEGNYASGF